MSARRSVAVRILGHEYRIRTEAGEEQIEQVARIVDETMVRIRERTKTVDSLDLAVLTALNLANDLLAERGDAGAGRQVPADRLQRLIALAESALDDSAEAR
ncbi:MAG: cell division protein ZapA [Deltaproteobacteria bacterium]|nr:cell division protein ZapA [Deltaproteobacteria bacterium]